MSNKHVENLEIIVKDLLKHVEAEADILIESAEEGNYHNVKIDGEDLSFLIGYHGKTLDAFQHLVNLMLYKEKEENAHVTVDINGYKEKRIEKLHEIARKYIDKARFFDQEVHLPPMAAWERRQVHMLIAEYPDVETESMGEKEDRHIVLRKRK